MNCVNTEGAFRIIQSISSQKAEPFKLWLAKVGYDRVKEIENPELAQGRMKELYLAILQTFKYNLHNGYYNLN